MSLTYLFLFCQATGNKSRKGGVVNQFIYDLSLNGTQISFVIHRMTE